MGGSSGKCWELFQGGKEVWYCASGVEDELESVGASCGRMKMFSLRTDDDWGPVCSC